MKELTDDEVFGVELSDDEVFGAPVKKNEPSLKDKIYDVTNSLFRDSSVMKGMDGTSAAPNAQASKNAQDAFSKSAVENRPVLNEGAKIVDGLSGIAEVGARKGYAGIGKIEAGAIKLLADVLGSETLSDTAKQQQEYAKKLENSAVLRGTPVEGFANDSIVQDVPNATSNAISSIITTAPALGLSVATGGSALPAIGATTGAQEYGEGRESGLNPVGATLRAGPMAAFEVLGEKFGGLDKITDGLRTATKGNGVADLGAAMLQSSIKEIPAEEFTTTGQFLTDKAPGVGLNQEAGIDDFKKQLKDTALTTLIQSGAMGAGGSVLNNFADNNPVETNQEPPVQDVPQVNVDQVLGALNQATDLAKPELSDADVFGSVENAIEQQPAEVVAEASQIPNSDIEGSAGNQLPDNELSNDNTAAPEQSVPSDIPNGIEVGETVDNVLKPVNKRNTPKSNTLLSKLKTLGGIALSEKQDITGENNRFAPGGYNQVFVGKSNKSLKGVIESGALDEYLPPSMRLSANSVNDEAFDSTGAYDYLSDRIRNGESILPYDVEQEIISNKFYADNNVQDDIQSFVEMTGADINKLLSEAGYDERESNTTAQEFIVESPASDIVSGQGSETGAAAKTQNEVTGASGIAEREGARQLVEAIVKRRAAANQLGKLKPFDTALQLAKSFMDGGDVSPSKFKNAAITLKNDKPLADALMAMHEMAKVNAKAVRDVKQSTVSTTFNDRINAAKSTDELQALAREIQADRSLSDSKANELDDLVMARMDSLDVPDRRKDVANRKRIDQMSVDELRKEILIDSLTGLGNRRAYEESVKLPVQVSIDADALKWVNDNMGHEVGDDMLALIGEALGDHTSDAYHVSGDEYIAQFNEQGEADSVMQAVQDILNQVEVKATLPNGDVIVKKGVGFSYGTGKTLSEAENGLQKNKQAREEAGYRSARGQEPSGVVRQSTERDETGNEAAERQNQQENDLLGDNTANQQALADAEREKDAKRNTGVSDTEGFTLTGSDSEADKAAANGAQTLFRQSDPLQEFLSKGIEGGLNKSQIDKSIKKGIYGIDVDVYDSMAEAPDYVQIQAYSEGAFGVEGFFDSRTNRVALIANNITSAKRAIEVARHELIGHYGMENMLGKELMAKLINQVLQSEKKFNKTIVDVAKQVDETQPGLSDKRRAKEIIAVMAERNYQNSIVRQTLDAIRRFLNEIGLIKSDLTDAEVSELLRKAQAYLRKQNRTYVEASDVSFSKVDSPDTEAFKKWFGDSKVVDADGKPLVVYHGTDKTFNKINMKKGAQGIFWFTSDKSAIEAGEVGAAGNGSIMELYAKLENPAGWKEYDKFGIGELIARGFDGAMLPEKDGSFVGFIFEPNQVKSATKNNGNFDANNNDIRFSRKDADTSKEEKNSSIIRDDLGRFKSPTGIIYDKTADVVQMLAEKIAFGQAPKELRKLTRLYKADIQKAMDSASNVVKTMSPMTQLDRALVSDVVEKMVATGVVPPEHIVKIATGMQNAMDTQTDELVKLSMLSKESANRWRGKYLPRFYMRDDTDGVKAWVGKMMRNSLPVRGIGGNSLKGRGLFEEVNINEVTKYEALGWEVRDPLWKKNQQGELELTDSTRALNPEKVVMWRDFTPAERATMGENRDALFRFVMGYTSMQNDIALGRMFDSIAKNQEWTRARASDGFVKVPDSDVPDTGGVKRYGNLAGLYVKKEILDHISQYEESSELWKYYRKALSFWKMGKTVLNPVSHMNNVVSNLTMAHFAGVSYWDAHKYIGAIKDFVKNDPMIQEAKDRGLMTGDITRSELMADMPDDIKAMMQMQDSEIKKKASTVFNIVTLGLSNPMSKAYRFEDDFFKYLIYRDARKNGLGPDDAVDYATKYIFTYDDLPKGARTVRDLMIPFFAYTYKAVPALTHTLFNYPWRFMAPAAALYGLNAIAYGLAAGDEDDDWQIKYEKGKELEEEERKNLPPWMRGNTALGTSKTMRLGTDEKTGLPVYMDVSRMVPGGDVFDVTNQADGVALPAPIMPSNPVLTTIAAMIWNKDTFTGKEVVDLNDTTKEASQKRAEWLLKQLSPAIAPTGYHFDRLSEAVAQMSDDTIETPWKDYTGYGKDGLPVQPGYAAAQTIGVKARPIDLQRSADIAQGQDMKEVKSIIAEIRQAGRLLDQNAISQREYDRRIAESEIKIEAIESK